MEKKLLSGTATATTTRATPNDPFAITTIDKAVVSEARVERDADGKIVRVLGRPGDNPLNDPLALLDSDDSDGEELEDDHGLEKSGLSRKQSSTTRDGGQVSSQIRCRTSTGRSENDGRGLFTPWAVQLANVRCTISSERREQYQMSWC